MNRLIIKMIRKYNPIKNRYQNWWLKKAVNKHSQQKTGYPITLCGWDKLSKDDIKEVIIDENINTRVYYALVHTPVGHLPIPLIRGYINTWHKILLIDIIIKYPFNPCRKYPLRCPSCSEFMEKDMSSWDCLCDLEE